MTPVPRWPCGSSHPATDASSACSTAKTNSWPWPEPCASPISPRCRARRSTDPTTCHWWRVRSPRREDAERIREIRASSRRLITIGACASAGGIQALRNFAAEGAYVGAVYAHPEYISSLSTSTPIAAHVAVDLEVQGCPIDRHQLLEVITAELAGRKPVIPTHTVCQECKGRGTVCLLVAHGTPCLGPVTRAGCGALCPSIGRGCFGCFGPSEGANTDALAQRLLDSGMAPVDASRLFATFYAGNPVFGQQSRALSGDTETVKAERGRDDPRFGRAAHSVGGGALARGGRGLTPRGGARRRGRGGGAQHL